MLSDTSLNHSTTLHQHLAEHGWYSSISALTHYFNNPNSEKEPLFYEIVPAINSKTVLCDEPSVSRLNQLISYRKDIQLTLIQLGADSLHIVQILRPATHYRPRPQIIASRTVFYHIPLFNVTEITKDITEEQKKTAQIQHLFFQLIMHQDPILLFTFLFDLADLEHPQQILFFPLLTSISTLLYTTNSNFISELQTQNFFIHLKKNTVERFFKFFIDIELARIKNSMDPNAEYARLSVWLCKFYSRNSLSTNDVVTQCMQIVEFESRKHNMAQAHDAADALPDDFENTLDDDYDDALDEESDDGETGGKLNQVDSADCSIERSDNDLIVSTKNPSQVFLNPHKFCNDFHRSLSQSISDAEGTLFWPDADDPKLLLGYTEATQTYTFTCLNAVTDLGFFDEILTETAKQKAWTLLQPSTSHGSKRHNPHADDDSLESSSKRFSKVV